MPQLDVNDRQTDVQINRWTVSTPTIAATYITSVPRNTNLAVQTGRHNKCDRVTDNGGDPIYVSLP